MESDLNENENDILESVLHALQVLEHTAPDSLELYKALDDLVHHTRYWLVYDRGIKKGVFDVYS